MFYLFPENFSYYILQVELYCYNLIILELDERMRDLRNELQTFEGEEYEESHKQKALEALKRMESWNLFSDTFEVGNMFNYQQPMSCNSTISIIFRT